MICQRIILFYFFAAIIDNGNASTDAERLYDDLINGYNSLIRPVGNNSDQLTVRLSLRLSQLIEVVSRSISS
jgi:hypothetical protein